MQDTEHPERAGNLLHLVASAMETAIEILRGRIRLSALFISPLGLMYWERILKRFVYMLMEVCKARRIDFAIYAPNLLVGCGDLRPAALSYHRYFVVVSRVLQSIDRYGNAQLTPGRHGLPRSRYENGLSHL